MNIKYILEQEYQLADLRDTVLMLSGVECYNIADMETGELIIRGATAQDIIALGDLMSVLSYMCRILSARFLT